MTSSIQDPIARYYDRNTLAFLRLGGSGDSAAIHRKIWAPGVKNQAGAFQFLNQLVADAIYPIFSNPVVNHAALDLGCGVGGTTTWIAEQLQISVTGVSNSPKQVKLATERARRLDLDSRVRFILADFLELPEVGIYQAAWAIESFVHAPDPTRFFSQVAERLVPGGLLVICDDFLAKSIDQNKSESRSKRRWLEQFRNGWHISNLSTVDQAVKLAGYAGFHLLSDRDLTPWMRSFHPLVLQFISTLTRLPLPLSYWQNLAGGSALQICQRNGWMKYHALILEKS